MEITFQREKKIPVKLLEITFKRNKQKHYSLIISGNLHILMKYRFIDICVIILFQKSNFSVTARDFIFHYKHIQSEGATGGVRKLVKMRLQHRCFPVKLAKCLKNTYFEHHLSTTAPVQYDFLVL